MTNLDKAIEISESPAQYDIPFNDESINGKNTNKETIIRLQRYNAAMVMAKWKDDKFYIILACVKHSLDKQGFNGEQFVEDMKKQWEDD